MKPMFASVIVLGALTTAASAATVHVQATGTVDYNVINSGPLAGIPSGSPSVMNFDIDSDVFVNSPNYPTRGYPIIQSTFSITVGSATVALANPFPAGQTPYFVIRNNDPAVDGFFISTDVDNLGGVRLNTNNINMNFLRTFDVGTIWPTLNILDALGSYGFEHMSSYEWTFNIGPGTPLEIAYESISLTMMSAPCPGDVTGNHAVNVDDLLAVINSWGACPAPCPADITGNGAVNVDDLLAVINAWGACP